MSGRPLWIDWREVRGASVLEPHGLLDAAGYRVLHDAMARAGTEEPRAVIVDVAGLRVRDEAVLSVFPAVAQRLGQWPGVPLLVVASGDGELWQRFAAYRLHRFVPVHPSVAAAAEAIADPPPREVVRRRLPNGFVSASLARTFARDTCTAWQVPEGRREDVVMIVNELVENTLLHTYCPPSVRLERRRGLLTVGVYDDDPTWPCPIDSHRGGLDLVAATAGAWGCSPTPTGGKAVWAVLSEA